MFEYNVGNVCILTFTVSNGWPTYTVAIPARKMMIMEYINLYET